jgi:hypothetical protein
MILSITQSRNDFVYHTEPQYERRLCVILGIPTQEERQTNAAMTSASAADKAARSARWSMFWSGIAVLVSIVALAIASL